MTDEPWADESPATPDIEPVRRRRRSSSRRHERAARRRRIALAVIASVALILVLGGGALAVFRYLPALEEARSLRTDVEAMGSRIQAAGIGVDRQQLEGLEGDLEGARERLEELGGFLSGDLLVALARSLPPTSADIRGADGVVAAANHLFEAAEAGLAMGRRFVEIKERQAADPDGSSLALIVETMATSREYAVDAAAAMQRARETLATVPEGLAGPIESARGAMASRVDAYGPLLDAYVDLSGQLPDILGWSGPRRYLVLTQNPAELRPSGGLIGSYGLMTFDRGRVTEQTFQDVATLDIPWDFPFIEPPEELANYLLGPEQPWQLADAGWSPDFPTSAQDALRLYTNESGDSNIDGVLGITTYTIDALLEITGPVAIEDYDVTIAAGETTVTVLQRTRVAEEPDQNRKAILSALAEELMPALLGLPPDRWGDVLGDAGRFQEERLIVAWFTDPAYQELAVRNDFDGGVRDDLGDYVFAVDSNVAPVSKLNMVTTRALELDVEIDEVGNAHNTLTVTWDNGILTARGDPIRGLPNTGGETLGMFFRLLVPERSRLESVAGGVLVELNTPASMGTEFGRTVIGNYLPIPPGTANLSYTWISPYPADANQSGGTYTLTIQKQPGQQPGPLTVSVTVPEGFSIVETAEGLSVSDRTATLTTSFETDVVVTIRYER